MHVQAIRHLEGVERGDAERAELRDVAAGGIENHGAFVERVLYVAVAHLRVLVGLAARHTNRSHFPSSRAVRNASAGV